MASEFDQGARFDAEDDAPCSPSPARGVNPVPPASASNDELMQRVEAQAKQMQTQQIRESFGRLEGDQERKAAAAEAMAKNYAMKLDVVKQIEDFEIARREYYDHKRESNAMYWMAFTLIMKRAKGENTRYLDFFNRKVAAENTYVRCILEMKEESEKLKHAGHKSHESAFGAARKNLLDDLLGVQEMVAEKVHAFGKVIEAEIIPNIEGTITKFNSSTEAILREGEEFLEDIELAEGNVQQAYLEYRDQAQALEKLGSLESDLWVYEMRYRVAVGVLQETWSVCSKSLGGLFTRMKDTEMARRQAIHAALQTLHDQQTQYWRKMPEVGQTLSTLVQTRVADPQLIEKEIGTDIRTGAQRLEHSEEGRRKKQQITAGRPTRMFTPTPPPAQAATMSMTSTLGATSALSSTTLDAAIPIHTVGAGGSGAEGGQGQQASGSSHKKRAPKEFNHTLTGPLTSPLTKRVQVLFRKTTNVFKPWKPVLAVLTVDNYLHLFDLPGSKTVTATTPIEEVFDCLISRPESVNKASGLPPSPKTMVFPTDKDAVGGKKAALATVKPDLSLNLVHCEAHLKAAASVKEMSFEVAEQSAEKGIKKVFKDLSQKKVALRGKSKEEMEEWCALIDRLAARTGVAAPRGAK